MILNILVLDQFFSALFFNILPSQKTIGLFNVYLPGLGINFFDEESENDLCDESTLKMLKKNSIFLVKIFKTGIVHCYFVAANGKKNL